MRIALIAAVLLVLPARAFAASDFVLEISGIDGESIIDGHANDIDVVSFAWGVGPNEARRPAFCPKALSITKYLDAASPALAVAALSRQVLGEVKLFARRDVGDPVEYLVVTLRNARVDSVQTGGSSGEDRILETAAFSFAEVTVTYTPSTSMGGVPPPPKTFTYQAQKPCLPK